MCANMFSYCLLQGATSVCVCAQRCGYVTYIYIYISFARRRKKLGSCKRLCSACEGNDKKNCIRRTKSFRHLSIELAPEPCRAQGLSKTRIIQKQSNTHIRLCGKAPENTAEASLQMLHNGWLALPRQALRYRRFLFDQIRSKMHGSR